MESTAPIVLTNTRSSNTSLIDQSRIQLNKRLKQLQHDAELFAQQSIRITAEIQQVLAEMDALDAMNQENLRKIFIELDERKRVLEQQWLDWHDFSSRVLRVSRHAAQKIRLNVGGQIFVTSLETLTTKKNTFFSAMFSEHFATKHDADGEIFIDRNPKHFSIIFDYLRGLDITPMLELLNEQEKKMLVQEVDYYQIDDLLRLLHNSHENVWTVDEAKKSDCIQIAKNTDGTVTMTKVRSNSRGSIYQQLSNNVVLGEKGFSSGFHEWTVRIDKVKDSINYWIGLGVCRLQDMMPHIGGGERDQDEQTSHHLFFGKSSSAKKWLPGRDEERCGREWPAGTIVKLKLDCERGKLIVDDVTIDVPVNEELQPVFIFWCEHNQCTLLSPIKL